MEKTIYTAPAVEVLEIATEGVLCASKIEKGAYDVQKWTENENFSW